MPQLKPSPWLHVFLMAWASFLVIIPYKIITFIITSSPDAREGKTAWDLTWTWKWQ